MVVVEFPSGDVLRRWTYWKPQTDDKVAGGSLFVKTLTGKTLSIEVPTFDRTVAWLKYQIQKQIDVPGNQQRLIFDGKQLEDYQKLSKYGITDCCTAHLVLRCRGGMYHETSGKTDLEDSVKIVYVLRYVSKLGTKIAVEYFLTDSPESILRDLIQQITDIDSTDPAEYAGVKLDLRLEDE